MILNKKTTYLVTYFLKNNESGRSGHGWSHVTLNQPQIVTAQDIQKVDAKICEVAREEEGPGTVAAITNIIRLPI